MCQYENYQISNIRRAINSFLFRQLAPPLNTVTLLEVEGSCEERKKQIEELGTGIIHFVTDRSNLILFPYLCLE